jgi:hypothetical protein
MMKNCLRWLKNITGDERIFFLLWNFLKIKFLITTFLKQNKKQRKISPQSLLGSTFAYMKRYETKFDDGNEVRDVRWENDDLVNINKHLNNCRKYVYCIPPDEPLKPTPLKMRVGQTNRGGSEIPASVRAHMEKMWTEHITPLCGARDYEHLRSLINASRK